MINKSVIRYYSLYLSVLFVLIMIPTCTDQGLPCTDGSLIEVPAKPENWRLEVLSATTIQVKRGDTISFSASGIWDIGLGGIGPDGKEDWCECPISHKVGDGFKGPVGALIGRIGKCGKPFLIGTKRTITVEENGILFLGSNDNMGPCDGDNRGSCYKDNRGSIKVCINITN